MKSIQVPMGFLGVVFAAGLLLGWVLTPNGAQSPPNPGSEGKVWTYQIVHSPTENTLVTPYADGAVYAVHFRNKDQAVRLNQKVMDLIWTEIAPFLVDPNPAD